MSHAQLADHEGCHARRAGQHEPAADIQRPECRDPGQQRRKARRPQQGAGRIVPIRVLASPFLGDPYDHQQYRRHAEHGADEEDAAPPELLGEHAANDRPEGEPRVDGGSVDAEHAPPLALRVRAGQDRKRRGKADRAPGALGDSEGD